MYDVRQPKMSPGPQFDTQYPFGFHIIKMMALRSRVKQKIRLYLIYNSRVIALYDIFCLQQCE